MTEGSTIGRAVFGDIAPGFGDLTDRVLFDEVWNRPGLTPRERSLVTITSLISLYRHNELPVHVRKGLANGLTKEEITEAATHLAFYSGWPTTSTAMGVLRKVFEETAE